MKKILRMIMFIFCFYYSCIILWSQVKEPRFSDIPWGSTYPFIQDLITRKKIEISSLQFYNIFPNEREIHILRNRASIKYYAENLILLDIPGIVVFNFYNPTGNKTDLKLAEVEISLRNKDIKGVLVSKKKLMKKILHTILDKYEIDIEYHQELEYLKNGEYKVTINNIFVNLYINRQGDKYGLDESVIIHYRSNEYQSRILRKQLKQTESTMEEQKQRELDKNQQKARQTL